MPLVGEDHYIVITLREKPFIYSQLARCLNVKVLKIQTCALLLACVFNMQQFPVQFYSIMLFFLHFLINI